MTIGTRIIRAPRGSALSCKGWPEEAAPRLLINNLDSDGSERPDDLVVCGGSTWEDFRDLQDRGLTLYGQMTAAGWIYIGIQGFLQGTCGTFAAGMGRGQPLAATMNGGAMLVVEVDRERIARRLATGCPDEATADLNHAPNTIEGWRRKRIARSIRLEGNTAEALPEILQHGVRSDVVMHQTSAHGALNGYVPHGMSLAEAAGLRERQPQKYIERSMASMARHVEAMLAFRARGAMTFDYANNIRAQARNAGMKNAFDIPGCVPEYVRPLFCEGKGPFPGPRSREIPTTFASLMRPRSTCVQMMSRRAAGFAWRASAARVRGCPHASAGSDTAIARGLGCG